MFISSTNPYDHIIQKQNQQTQPLQKNTEPEKPHGRIIEDVVDISQNVEKVDKYTQHYNEVMDYFKTKGKDLEIGHRFATKLASAAMERDYVAEQKRLSAEDIAQGRIQIRDTIDRIPLGVGYNSSADNSYVRRTRANADGDGGYTAAHLKKDYLMDIRRILGAEAIKPLDSIPDGKQKDISESVKQQLSTLLTKLDQKYQQNGVGDQGRIYLEHLLDTKYDIKLS